MSGKVSKSTSIVDEENTDPVHVITDPRSITDRRQLIELANKNKSKKFPFCFKEMLKGMVPEDIDKMWSDINDMVSRSFDDVLKNRQDTSRILDNNLSTNELVGSNINAEEVAVEKHTRKSRNKQAEIKEPVDQVILEMGQVIQAAIDLGLTVITEGMPVSPKLMYLIIFLNAAIFELPTELENLKNSIALLCESFYHMNYVENRCELFTFNTLKYLLIRSSNPKAAKKDVRRVYTLRSLIPNIIALKYVDSNSVWELLKTCVTSQSYLSITEGQKIITLSLIMDVDRTYEIHNVIKKKLYTCNQTEASVYGKAYYEAWSHAVQEELEDLLYKLEIYCIQDFILLAVQGNRRTLVENLRKLMSHFHYKKKETHVEKMLYKVYQPILWRYLKGHNGLHRANCAALFFEVFPLVDPDADLVASDLELNDQMLTIKDLLLDECPAIRICAIIKLTLAMSVQWELFPSDMVNTYLKILIEDLSHDSSTAEVRSSVAKGLKGLLENPLSVPTLQSFMPQLNHLFHDVSYSVRIAFCQLLLSVKKVLGIKYFEIVPLSHLLNRMEDNLAICKVIVNLTHNSFFPKNETPSSWVCRCADLMRLSGAGYRHFFHFVPLYIGVNNAVKFMVQAIKTVHFYVRSKTASEKSYLTMNNSFNKNDSNCNDTMSCEILEERGFQELDVICGYFDACAILWFSCNLAKEEYKAELKLVVKSYAKYIGDLVLHYKDSPIWYSVFFLASFMPAEHVPCLVDLCFQRLNTCDKEADPGDYDTLLQCLCNQKAGDQLLMTLNSWIQPYFFQTKKMPVAKQRKISQLPDSTKPVMGVKLLNYLLDRNPCQKTIIAQNSKELKLFLELAETSKQKIESVLFIKATNDSQPLVEFLFALMKIAVLLHEEENINSVRFLENITNWAQEKLCKPVWGTNSLTSGSRKSGVASKKLFSSSTKELVMNITEHLCMILSDMTLLGYFNPKKCDFVKFGNTLLSLDSGNQGTILLLVSRLLLRHTWSAIYLLKTEQETDALQIAPDCFTRIVKCLQNEDYYKVLPKTLVKEIQLTLYEAEKNLKFYKNQEFHLSYKEPSSILSLCN